MAAWTTQQVGTGNWSRTSDNADSPWYDGGAQTALASAPGDGDTAVIVHDCTVDVDVTVGDLTDSITVKGDATLTIAEDITLTLKGDGNIGDPDNNNAVSGGLLLGPGATITDDSNDRTLNLIIAEITTTATTLKWASVAGSLSINSIGSGEGGGSTSIYKRKRVILRYVQFSNTGTIHILYGSLMGTISQQLEVQNCTFKDCEYVVLRGNNTGPELAVKNCDFRNVTGTQALIGSGGSCVFDNGAASSINITGNTYYECGSLRIYCDGADVSNTVISQCDGISLSSADTDLSNVFWGADAIANTGGFAFSFSTASIKTIENCYVYHAPVATNSHTVACNGPGAIIQDNIFEVTTTEPNVLSLDSNQNNVWQRNLLIGAGAFANNVGAHTGGSVNLFHNTIYLNTHDSTHQGLWLSENGDLTGATISIKSNLCGYSQSRTWNEVLYDNNTTVNQIVDELSYNAYFNVAAGVYDSDDIDVTVENDLGDITDPVFAHPDRTLAKWALSLGEAETSQAGMDLLLKRNGYNSTTNTQSDTPSERTVAELISWVKAGFAPTNSALEDAGHDGVTIGAVEGEFTSESSSASSSSSESSSLSSSLSSSSSSEGYSSSSSSSYSSSSSLSIIGGWGDFVGGGIW